MLELGRRTRPKPYGMTGAFEPLIPRELRLEVAERMDAAAAVLVPLDEAAVEAAAAPAARAPAARPRHPFPARLRQPGARAARRRDRRRALAQRLRHARATRFCREFREYERGTTAAVNAAVQPILDRYVGGCRRELAARGFRRELLVMHGNGGTVAAPRRRRARRRRP